MKAPTRAELLAERQEIIAALDERILQSDADFSLVEKVHRLVHDNTEFINERLEILVALKKRDPQQFDEKFPLEVRIEAMVRRETKLCKIVGRYGDALREIASCESRTLGDVVDIAQKALATRIGR